MYKQERKSGLPQYFMCLAVCLIVWILCDIIGLVVKIPFLSDILFVVCAAVVVYLIYTHYCAVFVYETGHKKLIVRRLSGKREVRKEEIPFGRINKITFKKPDKLPKDTLYLTVGVLNQKKYCYVLYDKSKKCLVFEPDDTMKNILSEAINAEKE